MKNKLAEMIMLVNKIDRNYIQLAWFAVMILGFTIVQSPSDGGVGPR